jgi:heterodisulfide reductase subunit B
MKQIEKIELSYFPGCSLATSAHENNQSLIKFCNQFNIDLIELSDWNCCGSSSAHSIESAVSVQLACRILSLAPKGRPLLVACPSCFSRLKQAYLSIKNDVEAQHQYRSAWGKDVDSELVIIHFFELLEMMLKSGLFTNSIKGLNGLKYVPYYGCMLARPPALRHEKNFHGITEKIVSSLGGELRQWEYASQCCGTFLTAARPDIVTPVVNKIMGAAVSAGADCIITACAMCHLNLEIRCSTKEKVPILHFSEVLSLAAGITEHRGWFTRHLINPKPVLEKRGII